MQSPMDGPASRRKFLRLLAASPILANSRLFSGSTARFLASLGDGSPDVYGALEQIQQGDEVISSPDQALDVMDFEPAAQKALPPAHFGYLATGVDDDATVRANREGFTKLEIRARRLIDVQKTDMSVRLFGKTWETPIVLSPVSSQKAFHPEGEIAVARAARSKRHLMVLSTVASSSVEDVTAAGGAPVWYQLYMTNAWDVTRAMIKRAEAAGCPVLVLTVDIHDDSNRETLSRSRRMDARPCGACHEGGAGGFIRHKPMFEGLDLSKVTAFPSPALTWDTVKRLRDITSMKLVLKGIVTREDAQLAVEHGADGLIVSNHGGRSEETLRSTIESLPEVLQGAAGKIPVLVDGGFRRGTDVFKALALGASAIGIGRPYAWGLAAFGQPGVETVLEILRRELLTIMRQAGTTSIDKITPVHVTPRPR